MASETTWTWLRAWDYKGTIALIVLPLAREYQLAQFHDQFPSHDIYRRPAGVYWDGGKMTAQELKDWRAKPFQKF